MLAAVVTAALGLARLDGGAFHGAPQQCHVFAGLTLGTGSIAILEAAGPANCCDACTADDRCIGWTFHRTTPASGSNCYLKDNIEPESPPRKVDPHNNTMSGLRGGETCDPNSKPAALCSEGYPCPSCGAPVCSCHSAADKASPFACKPPHDRYPFCDTALDVKTRVDDLVQRINDTDKPNMLTARGKGGNGHSMQAIPALGVPAYYWGTNCLHSLNGFGCVTDSRNLTRCPTNFPSGPSFGATFDRELIREMAGVVGTELRAVFKNQGTNFQPSLDCWGPVVNLNRDPRWGRNGEGGSEDAYAMGELAKAWTLGFQSPRPSLHNRSRMLHQGIITLKHMAANSLENTAPFDRHSFDANASFGVDKFVMADYYLRPFRAAIQGGGARGIMCSYNAVLGIPTCLSPLIRNARAQWGFEGYVTSDSDSVQNAYSNHHYPRDPTPEKATALALTAGQCDINSGDTYNNYLLKAVAQAKNKSSGVAPITMKDVDRALFNSLKQRFDLGLFDPVDSYDWPTNDAVGSDASAALSLKASQEALVLLRNDDLLLPLPVGKKVAVIGPHAGAQKVLVQPYPFSPFCADGSLDCLTSPLDAISALNRAGGGTTTTAYGCDLFNHSKDGFAEALAAAKDADYVVLGLGIETCGLTPAHNVNPAKPGRCFQEKHTDLYVFPDQYLELEAHDRTTIDLPQIQHELAAAILALNKPTVLFLLNGGAVSIDPEVAHRGPAPLAIIEAFYPGPRGGEALARGIFGEHNAWGRMPYTIYPKSFSDAAPMVEHDLRAPPGRTYRYYRNPTFPAGFGLSLTSWALAGAAPGCLAALETGPRPSATCAVHLTIRNTGRFGGDAVIVAYFVRHDAEATTPPGKLAPLRQLFDFQRLPAVPKGGTATVTFDVSADALAVFGTDTGDLVASAGGYTLMFDDGSGDMLEMQAAVVGGPYIVDPFPSEAP